jgi:SAM-dependent methyltransferase
MKRYLRELFAEAAAVQARVPRWATHLYLTLFEPPLGKTIRLDMLRSLLRAYEVSGRRWLDLGCGIGDLSLLLACQGASVVGLEIDAARVACAASVARRAGLRTVEFVAADATRLSELGLGVFDGVCCLALLEHVVTDVDLLRQIAGVLRHGGLLLLEVPNAQRRTLQEVEREDGHVRAGYLWSEVPALLEAAGFYVLKSESRDPLNLFYYWSRCSRLLPGPRGRGPLFALLAPLFIPLIRLSSAWLQRPGSELAFLAIKC